MTRPLILDANILIRAVLGRKVFALIDKYQTQTRFATPNACFEDAAKYLPGILNARALRGAEITDSTLEVLEQLRLWIEPIELDLLTPFEPAARALLARRDPNDWPILAAAWALEAPIWTEDQDFFGLGVATWTTANIEYFLDSLGPHHKPEG